jgi:hypothetical protein
VALLTILTVDAFISSLDKPPRRNIQIAEFSLIFAVSYSTSPSYLVAFPVTEETAVLNLLARSRPANFCRRRNRI